MSGPVVAFPLAVEVSVPHSHWDGTDAADLFAPCGTPWVAMFDGTCTPSDFPLGGHTVLLHGDNGVDAYYAHGRADGRARGHVSAGQVIGYVSNTGNANKRQDGIEHADECHLHLAIGSIDGNGSGTIAPWTVLDAPTTANVPAGDDQAAAPALLAISKPPPWAIVAGAVGLLWALDLLP